VRRALRLSKETLAELTPDDLALVAGAANGITNVCGSDFAPCYPTYRCTLDCMVTLKTCL
jgi:hypothetical protein